MKRNFVYVSAIHDLVKLTFVRSDVWANTSDSKCSHRKVFCSGSVIHEWQVTCPVEKKAK